MIQTFLVKIEGAERLNPDSLGDAILDVLDMEDVEFKAVTVARAEFRRIGGEEMFAEEVKTKS